MDCQFPGPHQPPRAPAGHGVRLRQTPDGHDTLGRAGRKTGYASTRRQSRIHLVRDQPQIVPARQLRDHGQLRVVQDHAARIVRCRPEDRAGAGRDERRERGQIRTPAGSGGDAHQTRSRHLDGGGVSRVQRLEGHDLVPWSREAHGSHEQRVLCAGKVHHVIRTDRLSAARRVRAGDCLPQGRAPGRGHVMRVAAAQLRDRTFDDGRGRVEIRIAHAQHDHVLTALARRHRLVMREPRIGAIAADALHKGREFHVRTVRVRC